MRKMWMLMLPMLWVNGVTASVSQAASSGAAEGSGINESTRPPGRENVSFLRSRTSGCTSFFANLAPKEAPSNVWLVTAGHCVLGRSALDLYTNAAVYLEDSSEEMAVPYIFTKNTKLQVQDGYGAPGNSFRYDFIAWKVEPKFYQGSFWSKESRVFDIEFRRPVVGEYLTVIGYPGARGPVELTCKVMGNVYGSSPFGAASKENINYFPLLACPRTQEYSGMSGAPVLTSEGKVIGIFSATLPTEYGSRFAEMNARPVTIQPFSDFALTGDNQHTQAIAPGLKLTPPN